MQRVNSCHQRPIQTLLWLMFLPACGGSTFDGGNSVIRYGQLNAISDQSFDGLRNQSFLDPTMLPHTGNATLKGVLEGRASALSVIGALKINVEFDRSSTRFTGDASNFYDQTGQIVEGFLQLSNARFERGADPNIDRTFEGDLGGPLTLPTGEVANFDIILEGDFYGDAVPEYLAGGALGRVELVGTTSSFQGRFAVSP